MLFKNLFINPKDPTLYRRWLGIIPLFITPGSLQFLSGRIKTTIFWFAFLQLFGLIYGLYMILPGYNNPLFYKFLNVCLTVFMIVWIIDAFRKPIIRKAALRKTMLLLLIPVLNYSIALTVRHSVVETFKIGSNPMAPTVLGENYKNDNEQDRILAYKRAYTNKQPQRGDVVVFKSPKKLGHLSENINYISRIVAIPGDTIKMQPPDILINGKPLKEPEIFKQISESMNGYSGYISKYIKEYKASTLGEDEYFIIGDNAPVSVDSRYFGPIKGDWIIGKAYKIYEPIERFGPIN